MKWGVEVRGKVALLGRLNNTCEVTGMELGTLLDAKQMLKIDFRIGYWINAIVILHIKPFLCLYEYASEFYLKALNEEILYSVN